MSQESFPPKTFTTNSGAPAEDNQSGIYCVTRGPMYRNVSRISCAYRLAVGQG